MTAACKFVYSADPFFSLTPSSSAYAFLSSRYVSACCRNGSRKRRTRLAFICASPASEFACRSCCSCPFYFVSILGSRQSPTCHCLIFLKRLRACSTVSRTSKQNMRLFFTCYVPLYIPAVVFGFAGTRSESLSEWAAWRRKTTYLSTPSCKTASRTRPTLTSSSRRTLASEFAAPRETLDAVFSPFLVCLTAGRWSCPCP